MTMIIGMTAVATLLTAGAAVTWLQRGGALDYGAGSLALALWVSTVAGAAWAGVYFYA